MNTQSTQTYVLRIDDTVFSVTREEYQEYYRELERWKYIKKQERGKKISYEKAIEDGLPIEVLACIDIDTTEVDALHAVSIGYLRHALMHLKQADRILIELLFKYELTTRKVADFLGISQSTVVYRKTKILKELKKMMES